VDPIEKVGEFAAFGAFLGALSAYARLRLDEAPDWAMHGMVFGGAVGALLLVANVLL
jgi:hypothetical protein